MNLRLAKRSLTLSICKSGIGCILSRSQVRLSKLNEELLDDPALLNQDPYGAWLVKLEGVSGVEDLLDAEAYKAACAEEE